MSVLLAGFLAIASMTTAEPGEYPDAVTTANVVEHKTVSKVRTKHVRTHRGHRYHRGNHGHRVHHGHHSRHSHVKH